MPPFYQRRDLPVSRQDNSLTVTISCKCVCLLEETIWKLEVFSAVFTALSVLDLLGNLHNTSCVQIYRLSLMFLNQVSHILSCHVITCAFPDV